MAKWIRLIWRFVIRRILWIIKDPDIACSCYSLITIVMSTDSRIFGNPYFFSSINLMTWFVSSPPPSPAKPAEFLDIFLPSSARSFASRANFSSYVSAYLRFISLLTNRFYLSFLSLSFFYSAISLRLISIFSSSSILLIFLNSSVRWDINAAIFLSGRS